MLVRSSIFNKARNSFGNTTAVNYVDNQIIIKSKISNPTNPNTPAQRLRRTIFRALQELASTALPLIQEYFAPTANNRSPYSSMMRAALLNYQGATSFDLNDFATIEPAPITNGSLQPALVDLTQLQITVGAPSGPFEPLAITITASSDVWWTGSEPTDKVGFAMIQPNGNYFKTQLTSLLRSDMAGGVSGSIDALIGESLWFVMFLYNDDGEVSFQNAYYIRDEAGNWNPDVTVI